MTLEELHAEIRRVSALYVQSCPADADLPSDVIRRGVAVVVMRRQRNAARPPIPAAFIDAFAGHDR